MAKKFIIALAVLVVLGIGFYAYNKREAKAPTTDSANQAQSPDQNSSSTAQNNQIIKPPVVPVTNTQTNGNASTTGSSGTYSASGEGTGSNISVVEIDYDGTNFSPNTVHIKANDWVFFRNKSSSPFWPASDPHPLHTDYPGFDALQPVAAGAEYKFQFTKVGNWGFHDHLNPSARGTVDVTQ